MFKAIFFYSQTHKFIPLFSITISLLGLVLACQQSPVKNVDPPKSELDSSKVEAPPKFMQSSSKSLLLTISSAQAIVRQAPEPSAAELRRYSQGSTLDYLGELTTYSTLMRIQGIEHEEPWLKVRCPDGTEGWIYGGAVRFNGLSDQKLTEMVLDKRLNKTFGAELSSQIKVYQKEMQDLQTTAAFRMLYSRGANLRNALITQLNEKLQLAPKDSLPDFFWLNEALPGFLVHLIDSGRQYQLYRDFAYWATLAEATAEEQDDLLIAPFLIAYQTDSIEYAQPDWRLALSEEESYSLLGRGMHIATLDALQQAFENSTGFDQELHALKNKLLDDISLSKDFWEDQASILQELDAIIEAKFGILKKEDLVELSARQKMLRDPNKYQLRTNLFEGGE